MISPIRTTELHSLHGQKLSGIDQHEFSMHLHFGEGTHVTIEDYWEYLDPQGKILDRHYSLKLRKTPFLLPRLIGHAVLETRRDPSFIHLKFDNQEELMVIIDESDTRVSTYDAKGTVLS